MVDKVAIPSETELDTMRAISAAGFGYEGTKEICARAGWEPWVDEPDIGFIQYQVDLGGQKGNQRLFSVCLAEESGPFAFVPLYYFDDYRGDPAEHDRSPFDLAYREVLAALASLSEPYQAGSYQLDHRENWPYSYSWWKCEDASLVLLQDEYDIQFGMDVSLWIFPAHAKVRFPLHE
jgi:hypothetical protein